ncbi:hypothetical protein WKT22_00174 [Candidatus Lokiarchaeum ossiferum]
MYKYYILKYGTSAQKEAFNIALAEFISTGLISNFLTGLNSIIEDISQYGSEDTITFPSYTRYSDPTNAYGIAEANNIDPNNYTGAFLQLALAQLTDFILSGLYDWLVLQKAEEEEALDQENPEESGFKKKCVVYVYSTGTTSEAEVRKIGKVAISKGYAFRIIENPTTNVYNDEIVLENWIDDEIRRGTPGEFDDIFLCFSSHGTSQHEKGSTITDEYSHLLTTDYEPADYSSAQMAYYLNNLGNDITRPNRKLGLLADACYSGDFANRFDPSFTANAICPPKFEAFTSTDIYNPS